jgi:cytochrome P450
VSRTADEALTTPLFDDRFYAGDPFPHYARLRAEAPVAWNAGAGCWVLSRHAEVQAVSTDPATFCSAKGILVSEIGVDYPAPPTMMHTDPPAHTRYRRLVQPGFAGTVVRRLEPEVRALAQALVDTIVDDEPVDIVETVAVPFPLQLICRMLGVPEDEWPRFHRWSDAAIPGSDGMSDDERFALLGDMTTYLLDVARARRAEPRDDLISVLAEVELDGDRLTDDELGMFLIQLLVAGNETTRNLLSGGLVALAEQPDQWTALRADRGLVPTAVEELLRWTTPVIAFMRTATRPVTVAGRDIGAGEPVLLLYASANRDEAAFGPTAGQLDVGRQPNPHLAFGFGPHFCIGAALARLEGRALLEVLLERYPAVHIGGIVERSASAVIAGVRSAPLRFTT